MIKLSPTDSMLLVSHEGSSGLCVWQRSEERNTAQLASTRRMLVAEPIRLFLLKCRHLGHKLLGRRRGGHVLEFDP